MPQNTLYRLGSRPAFAEDSHQERPRVKNLIYEAVEKPLTAVVANVGFGKTHAVSTLYEDADNLVLWLQLTKLDNLAPRLWDRLCYGIGRYNRELSAELLAGGFPESLQSYNQVFRLLSEEKAESKYKRWVVVFDDFHLIETPAITEMIEHAVNAGLRGLSFVLISNGNISVNLAEFREKGMLSSVTQDDLRLTEDEIAQFYGSYGIEADGATIEKVLEWTEGWPMAVYLIGLALVRRDFPDDAIITKELFDIFSLMERDIYRSMTRGVRRFFLKLSVLESVSPSLFRTLAGESPEIMTEIESRYGMLLHRDTSSGNYRVMTLLREFLIERHNDMSEAESAELHIMAAGWYYANGDKINAVNHYASGGDYPAMFGVILEHTRRLPKETAAFFIKMIEAAPPEAVAGTPAISVARVRLMINNQKVLQAYEELIRLRGEYEALPESAGRDAALGEIYMMSGVMSLIFKSLDFVEYFKKADTLLPEGSAVIDKKLSLAGGASFITNRGLGPGSVKKMVAALHEAMPYAARVMRGCGTGLEYLVAAEADYVTGDMKNAEKNAYAALYKAQPEDQYDIEYMARSILLRIATYKGDYRRSAVELDTLKKHFNRKQTPDCGLLCDIIVSGFYVPLGRCDKVASWILEDSDKAKALAPISIDRGQWVRARCLLHKGRYGELLGYLGQLDALYEAKGSLLGLIDNAVMRAIAHYYSGDQAEAIKALNDSYLLSYENNIIMLHVEFGKWMRTLARFAKGEKDCKIPGEWLDMICTKASTYAKRLALMADAYAPSASKVTKKDAGLSKREKDVLIGLCQGLTREEIASSCGLSLNTVKTMLPIIYDKLGATSALDAVRIAASLNLIV